MIATSLDVLSRHRKPLIAHLIPASPTEIYLQLAFSDLLMNRKKRVSLERPWRGFVLQ
jgi:hypothetical protein